MAMSGATFKSFKGEKIYDDHLREIMQWFKDNPHVTEADFSYNKISAAGAEYIAKQNKTLRHINLSFNAIGDFGAIAFAKENTVTIKLNLRGAGVDDGVKAFFNAQIKTVVYVKRPSLQLQMHNQRAAATAEKNESEARKRLTAMSTSTIIAFVRANSGTPLKESVIPLTPTILQFAGCAANPQTLDSLQNFMQTPHFLRLLPPAPPEEKSASTEDPAPQEKSSPCP